MNPVARTSDIPCGTARVVDVDGLKIAIFNVDDSFYALNNRCPHQFGPLGEGELHGDAVMCPWHLWAINVKTGVAVSYPEYRTKPHTVRVEGDQIFLEITDEQNDPSGA